MRSRKITFALYALGAMLLATPCLQAQQPSLKFTTPRTVTVFLKTSGSLEGKILSLDADKLVLETGRDENNAPKVLEIESYKLLSVRSRDNSLWWTATDSIQSVIAKARTLQGVEVLNAEAIPPATSEPARPQLTTPAAASPPPQTQAPTQDRPAGTSDSATTSSQAAVQPVSTNDSKVQRLTVPPTPTLGSSDAPQEFSFAAMPLWLKISCFVASLGIAYFLMTSR